MWKLTSLSDSMEGKTAKHTLVGITNVKESTFHSWNKHCIGKKTVEKVNSRASKSNSKMESYIQQTDSEKLSLNSADTSHLIS